MTFLHPLILAAGVAVGLPVAVHLLTRPKPVRLPLSTIRFVVQAVRLYISANFAQLALLAPTAETFRQFLEQQDFFVFVITIYVGAGLIANDRRANALQIYLSKPLTRAEYVLGKLAILMSFLALVTWLPAIVLLIVQIAFAGNFTFFATNAFLFPAITLFAFIEIILATRLCIHRRCLQQLRRKP